MAKVIDQVAALKAQVEYLKQHLVHPIDVHWDDYYGDQVCKYCHKSLGNKFTASAEHIKTCPDIPANKTMKDFLQEKDNGST